MPALVAGIHVLMAGQEDVDGRAKPGQAGDDVTYVTVTKGRLYWIVRIVIQEGRMRKFPISVFAFGCFMAPIVCAAAPSAAVRAACPR